MLRTCFLAFLLLPATLWAAVPSTRPVAAATQPATQSAAVKFLRFVDNGPKDCRLEASEVTYRNAAGVEVRLVSAVHIAERSYYQALSRSFAKDDAVLYEMVKPKGMPVPRPGVQGNSNVSRFQRFLKDSLNLEFQLDDIDYTRPNFVHADLDLETFEQLQQQRGESMATLLLQSMLNATTNGNAQAQGSTGDPAADLLVLLAAPDPERQVKLTLAQQMDDIEATAAGLDGPNGSVILTERNKAAIAVLQKTLKQGKKHISIFYGAAHMPDLSRRVEELGFKRVATQWHMAWDVAVRPDKPSALARFFGAVTRPATRPSLP